MAKAESLGQYKVVITADFSQLQTQFKALNKVVSETAKNIVNTMNNATNKIDKDMTNGFNDIGKSIDKNMTKTLSETIRKTETKLNDLRRTYSNFYKNFPKPPKINMPIPNPTVTTSGGSGRSGGGSTGFADYAARIRKEEREWEKYQQERGRAADRRELAQVAQRTAAHKAFWQEQVAAEQKQARIQNDNWRMQQAGIRRLQTQYNALYSEANQYLNTHGKMSEAVFNRLQGKMRAVRSDMTNMYGASPLRRSALEGIKDYEAYASQFGKWGDMLESFKHHLTWLGSAAVIGATFGAPAKLISTIADVEKEMAAMQQVNVKLNPTHYARGTKECEEAQKQLNQTTQDFIGIAHKYGHSVDEIIKAGTLWGRGYKDLNTVMELTSLSAKLAVADNMNIDLANRAVESVINGWQKQSEAISFANHVVDSWTKIAHNAQSSATDLAEALSRTGAAAKAVGVDFDTTNALASAMIKATGRSGAEVGNALKSLFSSIHSKKALAQLQDLGIEMYKTDENGQKHFRKLHDVFVDLMITSRTTSRNMEKDLLAISGGKFQWSKVASVLGSYQDFIHAYGMSINSAGFANDQVAAQLDTISRKTEQLKTTMTGIATGIGASGLSRYIKNILTTLDGFAKSLQKIPTSTYEAIGSFVKFGVVGASAIMIIRTLVKGIYGIQTACKLAAAAQTAEAVATQRNTLSQGKNLIARILGINSARSQATASLLSAGALSAEAGAARAASVATGTFAATVTAATAGLNIVVAAVATAVIAFLGYNSVIGEAISETDSLAQKAKDDIIVQEQQIQNIEAQKDFIGTLCEAHVKYQKALDESKEGTEQHIHAEEDLKATDKELAEIIGEDAASNIDWSRDVQDVIKQEQKVFTAKVNNEKQKLAEMQRAQIEYTQNQINWTRNRIEALKNEGYGWDALKDVIEKFVRFLGGALVKIGENLINLQESIRETPILGNIAKMAGFGEIGSWSRSTLNSLVAKGHEMQSFNGQPIIDSMKNLPVFGKVWQGMIDHFYGFNGIMGSHSNRENELAYQEEDLKKLEKELVEQRLDYFRKKAEATNADDSGEVPDGGDDKKKKGKTPKTPKEADNSIEAMLYRHMTKALKLTHAQAIGELANIQQESGFNYLADNGTHKGLYQFDSTRWARYEEWLKRTGRTNSAVSQVDYRHLSESKEVEFEASQNQKYLLSGATTPREWAAAFNEYIERSGEKEGDIGFENRMRNADTLDKRMAKRNGEENFDDVLGARTDAYKALKERFDEEIEKLETDRAKVGQGVSAEEKLKIFEKMMGLDKGGDNVIFAEVKKAQKDYAKLLLEKAKEESKRVEAIKKAADTQTQAIEKMADAEIAFAEKLGIINKADVRKYNYEKNEKNYATNKPLHDAKLGATVDLSKGTADDMMEVYQKLLYAKSDMERKQYAERIFWLSRDVEATSKALSEELKLEEAYQKKRRELNEEAFLEKNKYALKFIDSLSTAIGNGLEGILNRTKSFGEAFKDIFKSVVNDIIKMFSEDFAKRIKKWLSNIFFKPKKTGNEAGSFFDADNIFGGGKKNKAFDLMGWAKGGSGLKLLGGGKGSNPFLQAIGLTPKLATQVKTMIAPVTYTLRNSIKTTFDGLSNITQQGMYTISGGIQAGTQSMGITFENYKNLQVMTNEVGDNAIIAQNQATAATVRTTTATMMGWLMAVLALFSLFGGGGGGGSSTSTSSENLGRAPETYYMTPTPVLQSTTYQVPSFDVGGNIEEDMFAFVHKNEMILTPEQADVIRGVARNNNSGNFGNNSGTNASIKSNINVSTVDSKGFDRVLRDYSRDLSKNVKKGIRNGYLSANGLV